MVIKLTDETLVAAIGATGAADFQSKLVSLISNAQTNAKFMADSTVTLESIQKSITSLQGSMLTEARVKELIGESVPGAVASAMSNWAGSEAGKKIIGAEASRITMEALSSVGTQPAKPAPITASGDSPEAKAAELNTQGKFEEAWKMDKNLRAEFPTAKSYAAYMRNRSAVKITQRN